MLKIKDIDQTQAPLLDHLVELRTRLLRCVLALAVAFGVCLYFANQIFALLVRPLAAAFPKGQGTLIYTKLYEAFFVEIKVALFAAFFVTFRSSPTSCGPSSHRGSTPRRRRPSCRSCWRPWCCSSRVPRSPTSSSC